MADLQKKADGKGITYPGTAGTGDAVVDSKTSGTKLYIFLNGGIVDGKAYPKVDMSLWDQATMCGTCHVGGSTYEHDRNGMRLPMKTLQDMGSGDVNPFTSTVWESYTAAGIDSSFATIAPWVYPQYAGNNPANGPIMADPNYSWIKQNMTMKDPNTGADMPVTAHQLMMPNVKEMDCLFCHLSGYDNVMSSVMTQAGSLNAAPAAGAGLFDMVPISPTYMGYNGSNGTVSFTRNGAAFGPMSSMQSVSFTPAMLARIKPLPESNNCMQCHATKTLKNLPEMFGTTGNSNGFLSSAPMIYDPAHAVGPLGKRMTAYDINAMWLFTGNSDAITGMNFMEYMMPGMPYLQAMGPTPLSSMTATPGFLGGGNAAGTGPLYYYNDTTTPDQNVLKRSTMPFPRAEWFKRGDAWQAGQDVHGSFGCAGCHFTGDTTHKNQCDPGRGFDMSSTTQDGVPPLSVRQVVKEYDANGVPVIAVGDEIGAAVQKHDTRNTVKRCEFCHVTGKDYYGNAITTFGAPNPNAAHARFGLTADVVQIVDKVSTHGTTYGGQGVAAETNFTTPTTRLGRGNHLDVMDCTVCHVKKESMAVRALDATSGMRFPAIVGTDPSKGMVGLFEDPAPDSFNAGVVMQYNQMFAGINQYFGYTGGEPQGAPATTASPACVGAKATYGDAFDCNNIQGPGYQNDIPAGTHVMGGPLKEWKPLNLWQKLGNMEGPLTFGNGANSNLEFRRKIYLSNAISAVIWNNTDAAVDANGDTVPGGLLIGDNDEHGRTAKPSLVGYTDVFDGAAPDKNNTQGYGEPIYDPWVQHDLKAGMNFGPSALSVISIGFDDMMTKPSGSAYMPDGTFSAANYWKYASVWSGAVTFTEPYQIQDYKAYRNTLEAAKPLAERKSWNGTELAYVGAPFMVTHGVKPTATYTKGRSCTDCHAPGAEFFNGGFDMTGTAIPTDRIFNPTSQVSVNQLTGESTRIPGVPGLESASNLMQRPLEPIRVKAFNGDLRTCFEGFNKLGQPRTSKFEATDGTYTWTTDLKRSNVLYPEEDGAIYYKIADTNPDGTIKEGAVAMTGQEYADYMETLGASAATAYGIGAAPVAAIDTVGGIAANPLATMQLTKGVAYELKAGSTTSFTAYTWDTNAGVAAAPGAVSSVTFTKPGLWRITLTATNPDGQIVTKMQRVNVVEPSLMSLGGVSTALVSGKLITTVPVTITAPDYDTVKISWGDGSKSTTVTTLPLADQTHQYLRFNKFKYTEGGVPGYRYTTTVQLFKGTVYKGAKSFKVFVPTAP